MLLESHGIDSILFDAEVHSYLGVGAVMPVRLMALDEDSADARAILTEGDLLPPG
ncbi:putative signal transducing protein [Sphingomonas sp. LHG3443-2]|uniref:putative signal transducing protein n=1 Tax=Sphingomonas sp. LHG3443-2 TaxID=2804639 RepID=UPI003CEA51A3